METKRRPWGISFLAILSFISVLTYGTLTVLTIAAPETLRSILVGLSPQGSGPEMLLNLGPVLGIYFGVMTVFAGLIGYGMWTLRNWARLVISLIAALSLLGTIASLVQLVSDIDLTTALLGLLRLGLSVLVLWYLWSPNVRAAFRSRSQLT